MCDSDLISSIQMQANPKLLPLTAAKGHMAICKAPGRNHSTIKMRATEAGLDMMLKVISSVA